MDAFDEKKYFINLPDTLKLAKDLLEAVQTNNIDGVGRVAFESRDLIVSYQYPSHDYQEILAIACNDDNVSKSTIEILINLGAKCTKPSKKDLWEALHYTAINSNKEKMETVIRYISKEEVNSMVRCSKEILRKYPFCQNIERPKTYSNNALSILLKFGKRNDDFYDCCQLLIDKEINVLQEDSSGVTPSDLIWKLRDEKLNQILKPSRNKHQESNQDRLSFIRLNSVNKFICCNMSKEEADGYDGSDERYSSCTLLQLSCAKGLTPCVKHLLDCGASINKVIPKNPFPAIMIAITEDHKDIVKLLLSRSDLELPEDILLELQSKNRIILDKYMKMLFGYIRCLDNDRIQKFLLAENGKGRTVLHYATHYRCNNNVLALLTMGSSLIKKDIYGFTPLHFIEADVLEKHFDNCLQVMEETEDAISEEFGKNDSKVSIRIDYRSLASEEESEFLQYMIDVKGLNHLMNHPLVTTFLALKWKTFRWTVYLNLYIYFVAYMLLIAHGFLISKDSYPKTDNLLLLGVFFLILFRGLFQILIFRGRYLRSIENIINLPLLGGVTYCIAASWDAKYDNHNLQMASSIVFLTSTLGIFTQLGKLSDFTIKVLMLQQIAINFFKFIAFYMFPIMAFCFCFYILREDTDNSFSHTLYQTITMFAGDANSDFVDNFVKNPIFGQLIYVIFVVLIGMILHNLLIGLAVSDLQEIQKQVEFIDKKERSKYVVVVEKILFNQLQRSYRFKGMREKLMKFVCNFENEHFLTVQVCGNSCFYVMKKNGTKERIRDHSSAKHLSNISMTMSMKDEKIENMYSLKSLHEKLQNLENLILKNAEKTGNSNSNTS